MSAESNLISSQPVPSTEIHSVAILGEVLCAGIGLVRALRPLGIGVRVLCATETEREAFMRRVSGIKDGRAEGLVSAPVQVVLGTPDDSAVFRDLFQGVQALAYLSPVGVEGRVWGGATHVKDLTQALAVADESGVRQVAYLSTLGADTASSRPCFREAGEAEAQIAQTPLRGYVFRTGPLMGIEDGWISRISERAGNSRPMMVVWGYGDTFVQPMHVDDLGLCMAQSFVRSAEELRAGIYAVSGKETYTLLDVMDRALEKRGRFKLKVHIPLFVLRLLALIAGGKPTQDTRSGHFAADAPQRGSFRERVGLLNEAFVTERNDAIKILGLQHRLKDLAQTLEEIAKHLH